MATARECPRCFLLNPPSSERCDCGYIFAAGDEDLARKRKLAMARFELVLGPIAALGGIIAFLLEAGSGPTSPLSGFFTWSAGILLFGGVISALHGLLGHVAYRKPLR